MKRWSKIAAMLICMAMFLTGCANTIPDLSEEQNAMVAEYAAGLLLKYDKNYNNALEMPEEEEVVPEEAAQEEPAKEETETAKPAEEEMQETDRPEATEELQGETVITDIATFLELEGISINYTGYEITDSYVQGEDIAFSLDATPGKQLLVVNFDITNTMAEDTEVDILNKKDMRFRLSVNDGAKKKVLYTMLMNDLSVYKNTLAAGMTENAVLICELPPEEANAVETISLYMQNGENSVTMTLQ